MKPNKNVLWVEVDKDSVTLRTGGEMPEPNTGLWFSLYGDRSLPRKEFQRWSGVTFPKGEGIYGLTVKLAVVERMRKVVETEFVAAKHTTTKLVRVP